MLQTGLLSERDKNVIMVSKFACMSLIVNEELNSVASQRDVDVGEGNKCILFMRKTNTFSLGDALHGVRKVGKSFFRAQNKRSLLDTR